jgi:hypothetical protein
MSVNWPCWNAVWSFGVLMWELWSGCTIPYLDQHDDSQVLAFVCGGGRLAWPPACPLKIYDVMMTCWAHDMAMRWTCRHAYMIKHVHARDVYVRLHVMMRMCMHLHVTFVCVCTYVSAPYLSMRVLMNHYTLTQKGEGDRAHNHTMNWSVVCFICTRYMRTF